MKGDNIVKEIQIKNFRSLKDTGLQTLSPITILVGENSSGKSTFLRAFPLLKQSISKRTSGPILWAGDVDDYVDFGSFEETVTNDKSDTISFRFKFDLISHGASQGFYSFERFLDDTEFTTNQIDYEITIATSRSKEYVSNFKLKVNSTFVDFNLHDNSLCIDGDFLYKQPQKRATSNTTNATVILRYGYVSPASRAFGFTLPNIDKLWIELRNKFVSDTKSENIFYREEDIILEVGKKLSYNEEISLLNTDSKSNTSHMDWYTAEYNKIVELVQSGNNPRLVQIMKLLYIYKIFSEIDEYILTYFKQVHYIAPLRATAERYYRLRNLAVDEVDYQGKNLAIFINSLTNKQLSDFTEWTNKHFGFSIRTDKNKGHLSLLIKLRNADKAINLSDTGFGYSQVLPIITQLWELSTQKSSKHQTYYDSIQSKPLVIAIEQPELHLHPAVQARLAKAFIAAIDLAKENGKELQLLLETHSQTIVDYLGRAIARGQLDAQDVSVILFEKHDDSTTNVRNSNYDSDGFLCNWPYGFFDSEE